MWYIFLLPSSPCPDSETMYGKKWERRKRKKNYVGYARGGDAKIVSNRAQQPQMGQG
jgi:hypothetical protein